MVEWRSMQTLREVLQQAKEKNVAIGHFNVANIEMFWAVVRSAEKLGVPVIIGVSEGERDAIGVHQCVALVESVRKEKGLDIFLNADHTYSVDRVKEAIDAGFDAVIFDGAKLPFEENVLKTKECVAYARTSRQDTLVEGELGYIGSGSTLLDALPEGVAVTEDMMTSVEQAQQFVEETGINLFAPAVGNVHGMLKHASNPRLNIQRVQELANALQTPLVLHGGSGTSDTDFTDAIHAGIRIVHVSTEMRLAYRDALQKSFNENFDELAPYKRMKPVIEAIEHVVERRLKLFNYLD